MSPPIRRAISGSIFVILSASASAGTPLTPEKPITVPGGARHFDFMQADGAMGRILAAHNGANSLTVLDLKSGKILPEVLVGSAQGVAVDPQLGLYFVGDEDEKKVVIVDAKTLKVTGEVAVGGPVDAIGYDSKRGMVYADEDEGGRVWVVDIKGKKVAATIKIPGEPEYVEYDPVTDRVYQNIKTKNSVVVINPASHKIEATWSTLPAESPHGLAIDQKRGRIFVAGGNGKLVGVEVKTGKVFGTSDIVSGVDQIAFDPGLGVIYCPGKGSMTSVKETDTGLNSLGNTPLPKGAKTLAIDPKSHGVWVSYSDRSHSYLQNFKPSL